MLKKSKKWRSYEDVATALLNEFRLHFRLAHVDAKQHIPGEATSWEIDAKAIVENGDGFLVVECRRYTRSRISQEQLGGLAYRIKDIGAQGGIVVSPLGFQVGAKRIAEKEHVMEVRLDPDSTTTNYILQFLNSAFVGISARSKVSASISMIITRNDGTTEIRES